MAVIPHTIEIPVNHHGGNVAGALLVTWPNMANNDTGAPFTMPSKGKSTVQVTGTPDGGNVTIEGANAQVYDMTASGGLVKGSLPAFSTLSDPQGNELIISTALITAGKIEEIQEDAFAIRPRCANGAGSMAVTVRMLIRRP